jgi:3D (Asp-Asp-Asp) domain-containing protein
MANERNIIVGAAQLWVGAPNTITTAPTGASTTLTGWTSVGFTMEGVEVSNEPDYGDVEVDQLLDAARIFKQGSRLTVNTTFAEATLENLLVVWGQAGPVSGNSVSILAGALGEAPIERSLLFVGPAPVLTGGTEANPTYTAQERVYHIRRAVQTESSSFALRRSEATGLPVSFRCLPDANASGGASYGRITDRAATTLLTVIA